MKPPMLAIAMLAAALSPWSHAQEMPAPTLAVGDSWSYRETDLLTKNETGQLTETVTAADAATYWIDARRAARTWWRGDAAKRLHSEQFAHSEGAPDQRGKTIASNDAGCAYPWPLKVGDKFQCVENCVWPNGWKVRYELKFTVEAAESVETLAANNGAVELIAERARRTACRDAQSAGRTERCGRDSPGGVRRRVLAPSLR